MIYQEFSHSELQAIGKVLNQIMFADGIVHPGEVEYLQELKEKIGLTRELLTSARTLEMDDAVAILKKMTFDQKSDVSKLLKNMGEADGRTTEEEVISMIEILAKADINIIH